MSETIYHIADNITAEDVVRLAQKYPKCWQGDGNHEAVMAFWGNKFHLAPTKRDIIFGTTPYVNEADAVSALKNVWQLEDAQSTGELRITDYVTVTLENLSAEHLARLASVLMVQYGPDGAISDDFHKVMDWLDARCDGSYANELLVKYGVRA